MKNLKGIQSLADFAKGQTVSILTTTQETQVTGGWTWLRQGKSSKDEKKKVGDTDFIVIEDIDIT